MSPLPFAPLTYHHISMMKRPQSGRTRASAGTRASPNERMMINLRDAARAGKFFFAACIDRRRPRSRQPARAATPSSLCDLNDKWMGGKGSLLKLCPHPRRRRRRIFSPGTFSFPLLRVKIKTLPRACGIPHPPRLPREEIWRG